jgi:hypothetical protein
MAQITHLLPGSTVETLPADYSGLSNRQTYPLMSANGRQFVVMPIEDYRNLKANKTGWYVLAGVGGAGVIALLIALLYRPNPQPMVIEKPVVVEKQVPVYKNCLLVCR